MRHISKLILSAALGFFIVTGCDTEELQDLNINPQAVTEIDLHYLFSAAQLSMASNGASGDNRYTDWRTNIGFAGYAHETGVGLYQQIDPDAILVWTLTPGRRYGTIDEAGIELMQTFPA